MDIQEYLTKNPGVKTWNKKSTYEGMLQFDDSASHFAGPFPGNFVYYCILNEYSNWPTLPSIEDVKTEHRFSRHNFPTRLNFRDDAKNEQHLQKRLKMLTPKELKQWELIQNKDVSITEATVENPNKLWIAGNDDTSYSKFFPTLEDAKQELYFLENNQPLNFNIHIKSRNFVFTN